jgi:MFS family permease
MGRQRAAVTAIFFINGALFGSLFARLPALQKQTAIGDGELGLALLAGALALLAAQPATGALVARMGSAPVTTAGVIGYCLALPIAGVAESLPVLCLALVALGATSGVLDVAMNVQGIAVERRHSRRVFSSFHAAFSFGGLAGAAAGGLVAEAGVDPAPHLAGTAVPLLVAGLVASRGLLPATADAAPDGPRFPRPSRPLAVLGLVAFCAVMAEGSVSDWSAIHLSRSLDAGPGVAAAGLAAFSLTMAFGRLAGDELADRFGPAVLTRSGALLAGAGLLSSLAASDPLVAIAGFAAMGAGLAAVYPLALASAGRRPDTPPGPAIGAVSATGYFGFLAGPPLIGFLSELASLRAALAPIVGLCLLIAVLAPTVEPRRSPAAAPALR